MGRNLSIMLFPQCRTGSGEGIECRDCIRRLARLVAVMMGVICAASAARAQGSWVKLAPFPEPAEEISGARAGGKMYVFAGLAPVWKPVGMVYEYDPASNRWAKKKIHGTAFASRRLHHLPRQDLRLRRLRACRNPDRRAGYPSIMHGNMTQQPTPGKRLLRCRASEVLRWPRW